MEFEHTSEQMARKLMEFNRDFSDTTEEIESEIHYLVEAFDKLKETPELNALAHHLDVMFMSSVFKETDDMLEQVDLSDVVIDDLCYSLSPEEIMQMEEIENVERECTIQNDI